MSERKLLIHFYTKFYGVSKNIIKYILNIKSFFFKSECFQYEEEYRFVISISRKLLNRKIICESPEIKYDFRESEGILVPYLSVKFPERDFSPTICIGPLIDQELASIALNSYLLTKKSAILASDVRCSKIPIRY